MDSGNLAGTEVDDLIGEAKSLLHRDPERCAGLLERAESAIHGHRDLARSARVSEIRGALALAYGELGAAATAYRQARRNWLAAGRRLESLRATLGCTEVQVLLGEFEEAETALLRVLANVGRETCHEESRVARLDATGQRQLADARAAMGQMSVALRHYDSAENLYAAIGDAHGLAMVNVRRALAALDAGLAHNAMIELDRARAACLSAGNDRFAAMVVVFMAAALSLKGQITRALELLDCVEPEFAWSRWHVAFHRLVRSEALLRAGRTSEARSDARAAEEAFSQIGAVEPSARAALAGARASLRWGRPSVAASELAVAERLFTECGSSLMRARTWLAQAELALSIEDFPAAQASCRRVMAAGVDEFAPYLGVHARLICARVEEPEAASALLDAAAEFAARTGIPELRVEVLLARARHLRRLGRCSEAIESLKSALSLGRARERHHGDGGAGGMRPPLVEATDELVSLLLQRGDHVGRIEAWRRARAAKCESPVSLEKRTRRPAGHESGERRHARIDELIADAMRPATRGPNGPSEAPLPAVPSGSLVEYYVTGDNVIAFVVRDGQVDARVLRDVAPETRRLVSAWQQECRLMAPGSARAVDELSSPALDGLYEMLLAPIADLLADLDEELQVVGHRHLHAVPFDALMDEVGPWYSQLEGTTQLPVEHPATTPGRGSEVAALVLAVPDANAPLITAEAEMIFRTLPTAEILLGGEATREALLRRARSADVVHFACHGVFREEDPLSSALQLGDGWLLTRDILAGSLGLEGSVVVLSACGSGLSTDYSSEPIGLASACLAAGASGVVAALWTVDDAVTFELMTLFYRALGEGMEPHGALRLARRQVARKHPHPYYWAAFRYITGTTGAR